MKPVSVKSLFVISIIAVLISFVPVSEALHSLFQDIDRNGDGKIDQKEFSENMIEYAFKTIDGNDSGAITNIEWDIIESVSEDREKHDELVKAMDEDKDASINFVEFSNYAKKHSNITVVFIFLDKDKNGVLSPAEIPERPLFIMVTIRV
jgi:Ca2+-binding EF-hand superfamily protein